MKFNQKTEGITKVENYEGGSSYVVSPEMELYTRVITSLAGEDKYYETGEYSDKKIEKLSDIVSREFLSGLAVYAREEFFLRDAPLVLSCLLARKNQKINDSLLRNTVNRVIKRADQLVSMIGVYHKINNIFIHS